MKDINGWEIVSTYSTKEAVADGFLVKVDSESSKEAGIKFPVYITRSAWDKYVERTERYGAGSKPFKLALGNLYCYK